MYIALSLSLSAHYIPEFNVIVRAVRVFGLSTLYKEKTRTMRSNRLDLNPLITAKMAQEKPDVNCS